MYDIAIIGGGPAGYVAAIAAAQQQAKVIIFEKSVLGGTCLNTGCIPTKSFLKSAEMIDNLKKAESRGIMLSSTEFSVDMNKAVSEKNAVVKKLADGIAYLLKSNVVDVINGSAKITADRKIKCDGSLYEAKNIIIATGSCVKRLCVEGSQSKRCLTSDDVLNIDFVPKSMVIVGGGVVGLEMATIFSSFGSEVTIIERNRRLLPHFDSDISKVIEKRALEKGIKLCIGSSVEKFEETDDTITSVTSKGERITSEIALMATGRLPQTKDISEHPIEMNGAFIKTDDFLETSLAGVYAVGDCNGRMMLAHAGSKMGEVAVHNILNSRKRINLKNVPSCVYTCSEVGSVGITEDIAKETFDYNKGVFKFSANGRALASGEADGFVKMLSDKQTGEILGCHIVGKCACELVNEVAVLMEAEITVNELSAMTHAHPTYSEAIMEAAAACLGKSVHLPKI